MPRVTHPCSSTPQGSTTAYFLVYVDDLLLCGNDSSFPDQFKEALADQFSLKATFLESKLYQPGLAYFLHKIIT